MIYSPGASLEWQRPNTALALPSRSTAAASPSTTWHVERHTGREQPRRRGRRADQFLRPVRASYRGVTDGGRVAAEPGAVAPGGAPGRGVVPLATKPDGGRDGVLRGRRHLWLPRRGARPPAPRPAGPPSAPSASAPRLVRRPQRGPGPFCFPIPPRGATEASVPVFFWAHVFYLSKVYELGDTLLILLARSRPLTLLHVYHHGVVVAMCYLWLATRQSLMPIALVTNAAVHIVMYSYYLSCSVGLRWPNRWKRAVTELQIVQFLFSFAASVVMLWLHFTAGGCEGMAGWVFNAVFNASLLALFLNFHGAVYKAAKANKGKAE